jgi:hypothetical protein
LLEKTLVEEETLVEETLVDRGGNEFLSVFPGCLLARIRKVALQVDIFRIAFCFFAFFHQRGTLMIAKFSLLLALIQANLLFFVEFSCEVSNF